MPAPRKTAPRKPQDHKRKASDTIHAEANGVDFEFEHNGATYTLPRPKFGAIRKAARAENDVLQVMTLLEEVADKRTLAALDDMDIADINRLFADWQRHMGVGLPES